MLHSKLSIWTRSRVDDGIAGVALVAGGMAVAVQWIVPGFDRFLFLTLSLICLAAFAVGRRYPFAVAAGLTGGMGAFVLAITSATIDPMTTSTVFFLSLAAGFAAVWPLGLVARPKEAGAWPLVVAAVLATFGSLLALRLPGAFDGAEVAVAGALIFTGAALIARRVVD
jgi:hypothetical protein